MAFMVLLTFIVGLVAGRQGCAAPSLPELAGDRHDAFASGPAPHLDHLADHALRAGQRTPPPASARGDQWDDHMLENLQHDDHGEHGDEYFDSHDS